MPEPSSQRGHRYSLGAQDADDLAWRIQVLFENQASLESRNAKATIGVSAIRQNPGPSGRLVRKRHPVGNISRRGCCYLQLSSNPVP
ncbi:hypothetical protein B0T13DRAFT_454771 [Neurospora crassa]|nr:hypothetical protein B0T13DRAFT_454771 [Neurospora crassa]